MVKSGQLWWAELPDPVGSETGLKRPVLVIQADTFNKSRINTVFVVVITSNIRLAEAPGNVKLSKSKSVCRRSQLLTFLKLLRLIKYF